MVFIRAGGGEGRRWLHKRHLAVSKPNQSTGQRPSKVADFYESALRVLGYCSFLVSVLYVRYIQYAAMRHCPFAELLINISLFFTPPQ